jgi:hypothetical protein
VDWKELLHGVDVAYVCAIGMSALLVIGLSAGAMAGEGATGAFGSEQTPEARATPKSNRLDQGSCWYAIFFCSEGPDEALRWTERHAHGRVIDTLSLEIPTSQEGLLLCGRWTATTQGRHRQSTVL